MLILLPCILLVVILNLINRFVTNRDSIASTLGKRLAQKQMARDLRIWVSDAEWADIVTLTNRLTPFHSVMQHKASKGGENNDSDIGFEGLAAIENHLDPTDFVAFNCYQTNLVSSLLGAGIGLLLLRCG